MNRRQPSKIDLEAKIANLERKLERLSRSVAPPKLDLELGIRDFGPIREGHIRLRPLTIFIGPNNSGKSYAALLARSVISLQGGRQLGALDAPSQSARAGAGRGNHSRAHLQLKAGDRKNEFLVTNRALGVLSRHAADTIATVLSGQIEKNFSAYSSSLVRSGKSHAIIKIPGIIEISIPRSSRERPSPVGQTLSDDVKFVELKIAT